MDPLLQNAATSLRALNPLDWIIATTLAVSVISAFLRGLILSVISLAGLLAGVLAAAFYAGRVSPYLLRYISSAGLARMVAFILILVCVSLAMSLLGRLLRGACGAIGLGFLDRLAGAVFGFARGVLLLAALLLPLGPYLQQLTIGRSSLLLPYLLPAAHGISFVVPRQLRYRLPLGNGLFSSL